MIPACAVAALSLPEKKKIIMRVFFCIGWGEWIDSSSKSKFSAKYLLVNKYKDEYLIISQIQIPN